MARTARIAARLTPHALSAIRRAAEMQGRSVSDFVVTAARDAAHKVIQETEIIRLSAGDQRAFAEAFLNPPKPTSSLRRAFERHRALISPDSE